LIFLKNQKMHMVQYHIKFQYKAGFGSFYTNQSIPKKWTIDVIYYILMLKEKWFF
jgi:hypothetical protein